MRRDQLAVLGIQLPVLPTIVLGGLPGAPNWAARLERIGLDVVASGAAADTSQTLAAAIATVPHRPVKSTAQLPGAGIVEGAAAAGSHRLHEDEVIVVPHELLDDANAVARFVLDAVGADPSSWWVAARNLADVDESVAEHRLTALVEGVKHVRLYLAKQQFDPR